MNSTGESDTRNYYDLLKSLQSNELTPTITPLDELIIRSALGSRPEEIYYNWAPLWQMTANEKADISKKKAETTKIYSDLNLFEPEVIQEIIKNQLVEDGVYPGLEAALEEHGDDIPEAEEVGNDPNDPLGQAQAAGNAAVRAADIKDATPRSLYVSRKVTNGKDIIAWAKSQGFKTTLPVEDLHVTVAFSRDPVDWIKVGNDLWDNDKGTFTVAVGGPRVMEKFGDAIVLVFASSRLYWRHMEIRRAGASFDFEDYNPHITISYNLPEGLDLSAIKPYVGPIELGPEIFAPINEDWKEGVVEV
jgi:hypothetical protein